MQIYINMIKENENSFLLCQTSKPSFEIIFQKVGQLPGGKWVIQDTKDRNGIELQNLELPYVIF